MKQLINETIIKILNNLSKRTNLSDDNVPDPINSRCLRRKHDIIKSDVRQSVPRDPFDVYANMTAFNSAFIKYIICLSIYVTVMNVAILVLNAGIGCRLKKHANRPIDLNNVR